MVASKDISPIPDMTGQTIDHGRFKLVQQLGSGAFGVVYRATFIRNPTNTQSSSRTEGESIIDSFMPSTVAIKVLPFSEFNSRAKREAVLHNTASEHDGVVLLYDFVSEGPYSYLIMDYCPGGSLSSKIRARDPKTGKLTFWKEDALVKSTFLQIVDSVASMHRNGLYHRDLKPDNILCNASGTKVYISDFGLATNRPMSTMHGCGTSTFMSPECIGERRGAQNGFSNATNDTWALGVILFNLLTAHLPWAKAFSEDKFFRAFRRDIKDTSTPHFMKTVPISKSAATLFQSMFSPVPSKRLTLSQLRQAVEKIDTFWMTDDEIATSPSVAVKHIAVHCSGKPLPSRSSPVQHTRVVKREADKRVEKWLANMENVPSASWCNNKPGRAKEAEVDDGDSFSPQWTPPQPILNGLDPTPSTDSSSDGPITPDQAPVFKVAVNQKGVQGAGVDESLSALELNAAI
ncbi:kinase-like domain-containing protein [Irpex rosettiformis]|uniref:Kinase-like domain-containing protein n=1 Tax=Irpex rosettiformis TaxID=378272 RepID=A0ACB8U5W2_9APHY|nr:kinase-like domain-containing protein [Irpex rosettiformis]